jgi:hypothetical protein
MPPAVNKGSGPQGIETKKISASVQLGKADEIFDQNIDAQPELKLDVTFTIIHALAV